jgi:glycosyltransferase involved in cell wall biosynthesis
MILNEVKADIQRIMIVDPVCVLDYGHNLALLKYFHKLCDGLFPNVMSFCGEALPKRLINDSAIKPWFDFCYHDYMPGIQRGQSAAAVETEGWRTLDIYEAIATRDAKRLFDHYDIGPDDAILFPGADFYGVIGMLNVILEMPPSQRPQLFLRLIGVMEVASHAYRSPIDEFVDRLHEAFEAGVRIHLSAETTVWADKIALKVEQPVSVTTFPPTAPFHPLPAEGPFVVFCPGSARLDKGFLDLFDIFSSVRRLDPDLSIQFISQTLPYSTAQHYEKYISQLYALPGVKLLPPSISTELMNECYARCHAVLLPYENSTYSERGSAVLLEAAYVGRPAVGIEGSGFADQIRYYGLGRLVPSKADCAGAILEMARTPRRRLAAQAQQARHRFGCDAESSFVQWFRGKP